MYSLEGKYKSSSIGLFFPKKSSSLRNVKFVINMTFGYSLFIRSPYQFKSHTCANDHACKNSFATNLNETNFFF